MKLETALSLRVNNKVILLRHANRNTHYSAQALCNDVPLNKEGLRRCAALAINAKKKVGRIYTSPLKRCYDTGVYLSVGEKHIPLSTSYLLGQPGVFINDGVRAMDVFNEYSLQDIALQLLTNSINPPGFCQSTQAAIKRLMKFMLDSVDEQKSTLCITHDSILAVLIGYIFGAVCIKQSWPDFLEGVVVSRQKDTISFFYRNFSKEYPACALIPKSC